MSPAAFVKFFAAADVEQRRIGRIDMTNKERAFLEAYKEFWSIPLAAAACGETRQAHYRRCDRDPKYKEAFLDIEEELRDRLHEEVRRRAMDGVKKPIMWRGQQCRDKNGRKMWLREYSDRMLELLVKRHCPEFRDNRHAVGAAPGEPAKLRVVFVNPRTGEESKHPC